MLTVNELGVYSLVFTSRKPEAKRFRKWVTSEVLPEIRKTGGYRRPETEFAGLSGERVEYERWLLERALLDAQLIALGMQSIGVHFERMVTDDPEFGAARANTNFADYHHELRAQRPSIDRIHAPRPTRFCFQPRPETCRILSRQDLPSLTSFAVGVRLTPRLANQRRRNSLRRRCHFPFAPMAAKLSSPTRPRFSTMTAPLPRKPANSPPSLP